MNEIENIFLTFLYTSAWQLFYFWSRLPPPLPRRETPCFRYNHTNDLANTCQWRIHIYTECNRRNGPHFGRVFLMLKKNPKHLYPQFNGYGDIGQRKVWTSLVSAYCILSVTSYSAYLGDGPRILLLHSYVIARYSWATLALSAVYSGWKSVDKYDTCASVFVVLFNGFMSLTSYLDEKYRY